MGDGPYAKMTTKLKPSDIGQIAHMTNTALTSLSNDTDIMGQMISRSQLEALIAKAAKPLVFDGCDFGGGATSRG